MPLARLNPRQLGFRDEEFVHLIVISRHLVIFYLLDGIVLVVVTLGEAESESEENLAGRGNAVEDGIDPELFPVHAALGVDLRVAMKAGRDALGHGGIRKHVARQLFDDKLIERQIVIGGADDPIAVLPHDPRGIAGCSRRYRHTGRRPAERPQRSPYRGEANS